MLLYPLCLQFCFDPSHNIVFAVSIIILVVLALFVPAVAIYGAFRLHHQADVNVVVRVVSTHLTQGYVPERYWFGPVSTVTVRVLSRFCVIPGLQSVALTNHMCLLLNLCVPQLPLTLILFGLLAKYNPIAGSSLHLVVLVIHIVVVALLRPFPSLYKNVGFCVILAAGVFSALGRIVVVAGNTPAGQGLAYMQMALLIVFWLMWIGLILWCIINYGSGAVTSAPPSKPVTSLGRQGVDIPLKEKVAPAGVAGGSDSVLVQLQPVVPEPTAPSRS